LSSTIHVLGFAGSLRAGSYNRAALRTAAELTPDGMVLEQFDLAPIPLYNGDVEAGGLPDAVRLFREKIAAADALLIATPEYNYSVPGVLKNAIDWASRPPNQPFDGKPVALMGAAAGLLGTARSQMHLRQVCFAVNMLPLNKPEVLIASAHEKFDAGGRPVDETLRARIRALMEALAAWARQVRG